VLRQCTGNPEVSPPRTLAHGRVGITLCQGLALQYSHVHSVRYIQTQKSVERNLTADSIWGTVPLEAVAL